MGADPFADYDTVSPAAPPDEADLRRRYRSNRQGADHRRHEAMLAGTVEVEHGTLNAYTNYLCRCDECRAAQSRYAKAARDKRRRSLATAENVPHGNMNTYVSWGCRCDPCRATNRERVRKQRERRKQKLEEKKQGKKR